MSKGDALDGKTQKGDQTMFDDAINAEQEQEAAADKLAASRSSSR